MLYSYEYLLTEDLYKICTEKQTTKQLSFAANMQIHVPPKIYLRTKVKYAKQGFFQDFVKGGQKSLRSNKRGGKCIKVLHKYDLQGGGGGGRSYIRGANVLRSYRSMICRRGGAKSWPKRECPFKRTPAKALHRKIAICSGPSDFAIHIQRKEKRKR